MQVFGRNQLLEVSNIIGFGAARMLNKVNIPDKMKIAGPVATLKRAKFGYVNIISSARFADGVKGLVNVSHKVDQKLQCFYAVGLRRVFVGQDLPEPVNSSNHPLMMIVLGVRTGIVR